MDTLDLVLNGQRYTCTLAEKPAEPVWSFPVGNGQYPPERWYAATLHGKNSNYSSGFHTGIDLNLDVSPRGDIERTLGLSVYAVADGIVTYITQNWSGVPMLVINVMHDSEPLWIRYAHIIPCVMLNQVVKPGQALGTFANWTGFGGGDHLHFDMALDPFTTEWCSTSIRWIDPVPVLKAHLDPARIDAMLRRG